MSLLKELKLRYEKSVIEQHLRENGGNRSRTAAILGISRRGLLNKIKAHGIGEELGTEAAVPDPTEE